MTSNINKIKNDNIKSIGLVLALIGMQFNIVFTNLFHVDIVELIMIISILFLFEFKRKTNSVNKSFLILLFIQVLLLIFCIFSPNKSSQLLSFHLYLISFIIALSSNTSKVDFTNFKKYFFWTTGVISIIVLFQATSGFSNLTLSYEGTSRLWLTYGGDPITLSRILIFNYIACLFIGEKSMLYNTSKFVFIIADIIGLLSFFVRSTMVSFTIITMIWFYKKYLKKINLKKMFMIVFIMIIVLYLFLKVDYFNTKITQLFNFSVSGVKTLFGIETDKIDVSAMTRVNLLNQEKIDFNNNYLFHLFFGLGYKHIYLDRPLLQAFYDLGIGFFVLYFYYMICIPVKCIFNYLKGDDSELNGAWLFVILISIQTLLDQLLTGLPYFYNLWLPTLIIIFSQWNFKKNTNGDEQI